MRIRSASFAAACIIALAFAHPATPACAGTPEGSADPAVVVAAERAFARASIEHGMKDAFLAHLAPDAIVFRPGPVPAIEWFRNRPATKGRLEWAPDVAAIASSGDLGFTAGPWRWQDPSGEASFGHYVTVWRREADGTWKVAVDGGAGHAAVDLEVEPEIPPWSSARQRDEERSHGHAPIAIGSTDSLLAADRALAADIEKGGWAAAFARWAADDVRVYRPGALPAVGKQASLAALAERPGQWRCEPAAGGVSRGDLGYTYGTAVFTPRGAPVDSAEARAYLRVWRMTHAGRRVVIVDGASPMPRPQR
jgi:ketosteroid isomerase-like protein